MLKKIAAWLRGKKSNLMILAEGVVGLLYSMHVISDDTAKALGLVGAGLWAIFIKAGMNRAEKEAKKNQ